MGIPSRKAIHLKLTEPFFDSLQTGIFVSMNFGYLTCIIWFLLSTWQLGAQPNSDSIRYHQVRLIVAVQEMMKNSHYPDAIKVLEPEIAKPGIHDAIRDSLELLYIRNLYAAGRGDSAISAGKDWAKRDAFNILPHTELYTLYLHRGDYPNAAQQLELALMRKPGDAYLISKAAFLYVYSDNLDKGERLVKLALERAKEPREIADALTSSALLHTKRKEYIEAVEKSKEAIGHEGSCADAYYVLGLSYARLGRQNMVCKPLRQSVELKGGPWCLDFYETKCGAFK